MFNVILVVVLLIGGGLILFKTSNKSSIKQEGANNELIPKDAITHGHGISVDVNNPKKLYIATHHGLMVLINDKELYSLSNKKDDYMGFSPHPSDSQILYSSGHPETGGNIGFQKSMDGGFTWEKLSDGVNGPVDFHAMAVSPSNPRIIYGWYRGDLQQSINEGKNWTVAGKTKFPIVNIAVDPINENVIYATGPQGLMVSENGGKEWETLLDGFVSAIAINPQDSLKLLSYSEKEQLAKSSDRGKTWEKITVDFKGETPLYISFNKQNPEMIYLLTEKNSIYKSSDDGNNWSKIR